MALAKKDLKNHKVSVLRNDWLLQKLLNIEAIAHEQRCTSAVYSYLSNVVAISHIAPTKSCCTIQLEVRSSTEIERHV